MEYSKGCLVLVKFCWSNFQETNNDKNGLWLMLNPVISYVDMQMADHFNLKLQPERTLILTE